MPPALCRSTVTYFPDGLRLQITGTRLRIVSKSSRVSSTPMVLAIANRCKTEFVEPPTAIITVMAFSKALRVSIWLGNICCLIASTRAKADFSVLSAFS